uniref:Ulp1 protease family, C-terminal catalytic domain containing protein n=1 Tax=Solanum tuberosum TaxID=4113 RepID=M1DVN2_SOLTU
MWDSTTPASISSGTEAIIDAIVYKLPNEPINVAPLSVIIPLQLTDNDDFLSDSQLPTQLPVKESAHNFDTKTPAPRNRIPSKLLQYPYVNTFGSSDKGKGKIDDDIRPYTPFEGCGITYQVSSVLMQEFSQWIQKGLLKSHANKNPSEDKYRGKSALFGFHYMDFVVAFPLDKNWFYTMSQPYKCWTDQHIDVIFYYLRKKSKLRSMDQYRYTTCNCLFMSYINNAYKSDCGMYVAAFAEFLSDEMKVPSIPL